MKDIPMKEDPFPIRVTTRRIDAKEIVNAWAVHFERLKNDPVYRAEMDREYEKYKKRGRL
jgi:hypothetical protein